MRAQVALVLLAVLVAGCSSDSKKQAVAPAVPWTSETPPQVAERTPVSTPCRAADLDVRGQVKFVPRLDGGIALVVVRNKGYPASSLLALRPGDLGALTISWDNWCDPLVKGKPHVPPSAVRITLPGDRGSLSADYNAVVPCVDPNAPSTIGVSVFQPSLIPAGRPWTSAFLRASVPGQPVHARRGGILHYRVVLKNDSKTTARFDHCPAYIQQLAPRGKVEAYDLNCSAARSIAHGQSLAFAMRVRVPRDAPLGPNGLFWELDPFGIRAPQLHARVTIDR
jgi:hypothetical protein